jgi:periplasmic divalent cation tolerance protein
MVGDGGFCIVLTTTGSPEEADRLAAGLLARKLAACVQVLQITSHYVWKGALHKEPEFLLLLKTRRSAYAEIEAYIREAHSYEIPELLLLPVDTGLSAYLGWIQENTI